MEPNVFNLTANYGTSGAAEQAYVQAFWWGTLFGFVLQCISWWKIFKKAGRPGWKALIPIYGTYVMLQIINKSAWWLILFMIPLVNIIFIFLFFLNMARVFNKGAGFAFGLFFYPTIFLLIFAFDSSKYIGLGASPEPANINPPVNPPINPITMPPISQ